MSEVVDVVVPEGIGDNEEIVVAAWLFQDGEKVDAETPICQLMVEKVSFDIAAPATGYLRQVAKEETVVTVGQVIARIESG